MMIEHQHIRASTGNFGDHLMACDAAIHRHQKLHALLDQTLQGVTIGAIALRQTIGNMKAAWNTCRGQALHQQRHRTGPIDIIIAKHPDRLTVCHRAHQTLHHAVHIAHDERIGHQITQAGFEKHLRLMRHHRTSGQNPRQRIRQRPFLHHGQGLGAGGIIQTVAPHLAGE